MITGAEILPDKRVIVLSGYNNVLAPFIYLLYDFTGNKFFDANKRKVAINQGFLQMEGICSVTDTKFYISNERVQNIITIPAKLQTLNLTSLLSPYYSKQKTKPVIIAHTVKNGKFIAGRK